MFQLQLTPDMISKLLGVSVFAVILIGLAWLWIKGKFKEIDTKLSELKKNSVTCETCKLKHDSLDKNIADIKETTGKIWDWIIKQKGG